MKQPRKSATVSKKATEQDILNAKRWVAFEEACRAPFPTLTDEWNNFFIKMGDCNSKPGELSELIDIAIEGDK